jgi:hypothetical protein
MEEVEKAVLIESFKWRYHRSEKKGERYITDGTV